MSAAMKTFPCEHCRFRRKAEADPDSLLGRFWRWHTKWCPGWKAYQRALARREAGDSGE